MPSSKSNKNKLNCGFGSSDESVEGSSYDLAAILAPVVKTYIYAVGKYVELSIVKKRLF